MSEKKRPQPTPSAQTADHAVYQWFEQEDRDDRRSFRASIIAAVIVHLAILFTTIPTLASKEIEPAETKKYVKLAPTPKFQKRVEPKQNVRKPRALKVPMPDPTPDEIEIYVEQQVEEPELELDPLPPFALPDEPPEPDPGPVRVGGRIGPPVRTHFVKPMYTEMARRVRLEGTVIIETLIDKNGLVSETKVLKGMGFGLTEQAEKAVSQWRFEPSTLNGKPVEVVYVLTVHYQLN